MMKPPELPGWVLVLVKTKHDGIARNLPHGRDEDLEVPRPVEDDLVEYEPPCPDEDDIVEDGLPCPDENDLVEYVEGLLSERRAVEIEDHLDGCVSCRRAVVGLTS